MALFRRPKDGARGPVGPDGKPGKSGPPGRDGRDGMNAPEVDIEELVQRIVKLVPKPKDGKRGPMGLRGERGPVGRHYSLLGSAGGATSGLSEAQVAALFVAGTNVTINYDPITHKITIAATGGGGGATNFTDLADVPSSYSGEGDKILAVNTGETGLEFIVPPTGFTNELAQDAIGAILLDSATIDFTYDDGTPSITAIIKDDSITDAKIDDVADVMQAVITLIIDGGGTTITTGIKGDIEIPFNCTIQRVTLLGDQTGSAVVDIWKDVYSSFPPVVGDSITASAKPTITTATKSQDSTLTGWTKTITAGDILRFNVDSASSIQRLTVSLKVTKT